MYISFEVPPLLYCLNSDFDVFHTGDGHTTRKNIGVFDLLVVQSGCLYMGEDDDTWEVREGEYLILEPDKKHFSYKPCTETTKYYWLHFHTIGSWKKETRASSINTNAIVGYSINLLKHAKAHNSSLIIEYLELLNNYSLGLNNTDKHQQQIVFQQLISYLMNHHHSQISQHIIELAENTANYLEKNFAQPLQYKQLSEDLKYHSAYITRCMKQVYGCSPLIYQKKIRLNRAKHLLLHTNLSIDEISQSVGFNSSSYFSRSFHQEYSLSPLHYRNQYKY